MIAKHKALYGMPHAVFSKLYDNFVTPVIEYVAALWGMREYSCISSVQNRALRYFMGCSKFTPNTAVRVDMGWKSLKHKQQLCVARFWLRLINIG